MLGSGCQAVGHVNCSLFLGIKKPCPTRYLSPALQQGGLRSPRSCLMAGLGKRTVGQGSANAPLPCAPSRVAALEAAGHLAALYPVAFSSYLVPRLAEELCVGMCLRSSVACPCPGRLEGLHTCITQGNLISWVAFRGVGFG